MTGEIEEIDVPGAMLKVCDTLGVVLSVAIRSNVTVASVVTLVFWTITIDDWPPACRLT